MHLVLVGAVAVALRSKKMKIQRAFLWHLPTPSLLAPIACEPLTPAATRAEDDPSIHLHFGLHSAGAPLIMAPEVVAVVAVLAMMVAATRPGAAALAWESSEAEGYREERHGAEAADDDDYGLLHW